MFYIKYYNTKYVLIKANFTLQQTSKERTNQEMKRLEHK